MPADTLDHTTLTQLVAANAIRTAHVVGQPGGWVVAVAFGSAERFLAAQRSRKLRVFRKLETVMAYLKGVGLPRFQVDASGYEAETTRTSYKRPDRADALRRAHAAAELLRKAEGGGTACRDYASDK